MNVEFHHEATAEVYAVAGFYEASRATRCANQRN